MAPYLLPLALLFIAFTAPSIAQSAGASASPGAGAGAGAGAGDDVTSTVEPKLDTSFLTEHLVNFELGKRLEFDCKLEHDVTTPNYLWYKNGYRMMEVDAAPAPARGPVTEREGRVLVFRRAHEDDYGNYSCAVGGAAAAAWDARAQPVARLPPNTNVVEGQNFSITCKLIGKPYLPVEWLFTAADGTNATVQGTADGRVAVRDAAATGVPRGLLAVAAATAADAGQYTCVPYNGTAAASTVRVKDVYAALWPFLGICLEVFVLCAIILVYEKRRTKPELDDSDADTHDQ